VPQDVISGWFNYGFKLGLMKKDVDIAENLLDSHFEAANIIRNTRRIMEDALKLDGVHGDSDYTEVVKILEERAGADLRVDNEWEWQRR